MRVKGSVLALQALDEAYHKASWHGPNLRALRDLAVHAAYWKYVVRRKLAVGKRGSFPLQGSNFFPRPVEESAGAWRSDLGLLEAEHRRLREAVAALPEAAFADPKRMRLIRGAAAHDLYHAGQIRLLRRLRPE